MFATIEYAIKPEQCTLTLFLWEKKFQSILYIIKIVFMHYPISSSRLTKIKFIKLQQQ